MNNTTEIKKVLGVNSNGNIICVESQNGNSFKIIAYEAISNKQLKYLNSKAYIKEFLLDSMPIEDIKKQWGSINKAVESIRMDVRYSDDFYPFQDNSYLNDYIMRMTFIPDCIFNFNPATYTYIGYWTLTKEELKSFKYILDPELFFNIAVTIK